MRLFLLVLLVLSAGCDDPEIIAGCSTDGDCSAVDRCVDGTCVPRAAVDSGSEGCPGGETLCGASCVDLSMNAQHCGGCGSGCGPAETCFAGGCVDACGSTEVRCGATCTDLSRDDLNCDACNRPCDPADECVDSVCVPRCVPADPPIEICNAVDDDCNGELDPPECAPDLVTWYRFEATDGPVLDSSGRGHDGDLFGAATRVPGGREGGALMSNGATISQVLIGEHDDFAFGSAFSAEVWVNVEDCAPAGTDHNTIAVVEEGFLFAFTPGCVLSHYIFSAGTWSNDSPGAALTVGTWMHLAMTWDGTTLRSYLDGNATGPGSLAPGPMNDAPFPLRIGSRADCCPQAFQGLIDDLRLYDTVRTQAQICNDAGGTLVGITCLP